MVGTKVASLEKLLGGNENPPILQLKALRDWKHCQLGHCGHRTGPL
jgi:hypothetical protein